jgi:peptidoglycan/xylan/chitin deacetylase (PgdA/CDA1 family)
MKPITLSFDNGPDLETTPFVLDVLKRRGVKTTFFVVGKNLVAARAPAERAAAEGHFIGNHTWSHSRSFGKPSSALHIRTEIERAQAAIGDLAHPDKLFRPNGSGGQLRGSLSVAAAEYLAAGRFTCVLWNCVPGDWKNLEGWVDVALWQVEQLEWPLVVLHDVHRVAMQQLDTFIGTLQDRGYTFRQEFPEDCVAMRCGIRTPALNSDVLAA